MLFVYWVLLSILIVTQVRYCFPPFFQMIVEHLILPAGGILDRSDSYIFTGALAYSFVKAFLPLYGVWDNFLSTQEKRTEPKLLGFLNSRNPGAWRSPYMKVGICAGQMKIIFVLKTSEKDDEAKLATLPGLFNISPWKPLQENAFLIY